MKILTVFATLSPKSLSKTSWWKGTHGEWYVVAQVALSMLVLFGPRAMSGWLTWAAPYTLLGSIAGVVLLLIGGLGFVAGIFGLGKNLTAVPYPKEQGTLIESGPYRFSGLFLARVGHAILDCT